MDRKKLPPIFKDQQRDEPASNPCDLDPTDSTGPVIHGPCSATAAPDLLDQLVLDFEALYSPPDD